MAIVIVVVIVVVLVLIVALALRRRRPPADAVDSFRRQIDALSRDARRPTIGHMHGDRPDDDDGDGGRSEDGDRRDDGDEEGDDGA